MCFILACRTEGKKDKCIFPFVYKGEKFNTCAEEEKYGFDNNHYFCATKVNVTDNQTLTERGYCNSFCERMYGILFAVSV